MFSVLMVLVDKLRPSVPCLYKVIESVSLIDLLVAFAETAKIDSCTKPTFGDSLALKLSKHPVLNRLHAATVTPNDVFAEVGANFVLITGPNMSGKSTYLRQIALTQIMAQIGCFVPATLATLRISDRLFARLDKNDDIEASLSTFTLEIQEMNCILKNLTANSLVLVDEFGRATSHDEGFGICFAACEELLLSKAFTFFATHFVDLTLLSTLYPNVNSITFDIEQGSRSVVTHRIRPGTVQMQNYGIDLIARTRMPREIITEARSVANRMNALRIRQHRSMEQNSDEKVLKLRLSSELLRIGRRIDLANRTEMLDVEMLEMIRKRLKQLALDFDKILPNQH